MLCKECYYYICTKSYVISEQIVRVARRVDGTAMSWLALEMNRGSWHRPGRAGVPNPGRVRVGDN
jgi:hypothetical protein